MGEEGWIPVSKINKIQKSDFLSLNPIVKAASAFIIEVEAEEEKRRKIQQDYQLNREKFEEIPIHYFFLIRNYY